MDLQSINQGLEKLYNAAFKVYNEYATAKAEHESLDNQKKTFLSVVELKYTGVQAEIARKGLADEDYKEFLEGLNGATSNYYRAMAKVRAYESRLACLQSLSKNYLKEVSHE